MKVHSNIYARIITLQNVFHAWDEFIRGKKKKSDVIAFTRFLEDNLFSLFKSLRAQTYKHGEYKSFYIRDPKVRYISKATVQDRVTHHLVTRELERIFDSTFYTHSYSCRVGKGTHKGIQTLIRMTRKASKNNTSPLYALKCDIKKFFASVDHNILFELLKRRITDEKFLWLLEEIINSYQSEYTVDPQNPKGMPIGNLTSQLFANIYLDPLDQYIKHELNIQYYLRYADDFVILSPDKQYLESLIPKIKEYVVNTLHLSLHEKKIIISNYYLGIDFLGYIAFPYTLLPRTKTKRRLFKKVYKKVDLFKSHLTTFESLNQTVQSYLGYLCHANTYKLVKRLKHQIWIWLSS